MKDKLTEAIEDVVAAAREWNRYDHYTCLSDEGKKDDEAISVWVKLSSAVNILDARTSAKEEETTEDIPATDLDNAQQFVNLKAKAVELQTRLGKINAEVAGTMCEEIKIARCLGRTVNEETPQRAFRVASNPNLVVIVRWFPINHPEVQIMELISP